MNECSLYVRVRGDFACATKSDQKEKEKERGKAGLKLLPVAGGIQAFRRASSH